MLKSHELNSKKHTKQLMLLALLIVGMTTAGCATHTQEIATSTPMVSGKAAVCLSLEPIRPSRGKPGGPTTEDISAALDRDNPIGRVRNLVGDTSSTLTQVDRNNAALASLCGESNGAPPR